MSVALIPLLALASVFGKAAAGASVVPRNELIRTANGVPVRFFTSPNVPLFEVRLSFEGGSEVDPREKSGLTAMTAAMLRKGIRGMDENALSRALDDVAGTVDVSVSGQRVTVSSYGLNEHADRIVELMFRQLVGPTFPEPPFRRLKANQLDALKQLPDSASELASYVLEEVLYNGTAEGRPITGLRRDVAGLRLDEVRAYSSEILRTDRLRALVVGGSDRSDVLSKVIRGIEALPCVSCGRPPPVAGQWRHPGWDVPAGHVLILNRPGISEAHVRLAHMAPKRRNPDFYELRVGETLLGGFYASRLNSIIREKLNLTYGISAGYVFGENLGRFEVATSTRNEKTGVLLREIHRVLAEFAAGNVSEAELRIAKDYITGSFPLGLQNRYAIAGTFFAGLLEGLGGDFLDVFQERINGVTLPALKAAVKRHLRPTELTTVIAGDARAVGSALRKAGIRYVVRDPRNYL